MDEDLIMDISVRLVVFTPFGATYLYLYFFHRLFSYIERQYPSLWEELGRPSLVKNGHRRSGSNAIRYLTRGEWKKSDDAILIAKARKACYSLYAATGTLVFLSAFFLLGSIWIYL